MDTERYKHFLNSHSKLYRFALSLTKDSDDAKDIHQESLMKLWQLRDEWTNWENFEAYAMRMVRNTFLNYSRKKNSQRYTALEDITEDLLPNDTDREMVLTDLRMRFNALINKLPEVQRNILYLREIEEMEYKEISQILQITESQVKVYLFRGRQYLRNKMHGKR
ncbi:RNA polymerase sigma factor [Pedobacter foliorum]|uniref:RNA polymerase sigma factor n=1 Tax=Pedobacter foliorum TaxID=2739058 RepID=UPI00156420BB|nr:sigma-70 family RNA polymerase sigma factor [Pedobacter foliorum]NRF37716.1 sigma-70 family RNA polymerase sigma factor [Pedobacter foliorum]